MQRQIYPHAAPDAPLARFAARQPGFDLTWDILRGSIPDLPDGAVLLHLAAALPGRQSDLSANAAMIAPVLAACQRHQIAHLFFASTAAVYDGAPEAAAEDMAPAPQSAYGRAKFAAETVLRRDAGSQPYTILRIGNVLGADALLGDRGAAAGPIALDHIDGATTGPLRSRIAPLALARNFGRLIKMVGHAPLPEVLNLAQDPPIGMAELLLAAGREWQWSGRAAALPRATLNLRRLHGLLAQDPVTAADLIADLQRYQSLAAS